MNTHNKYARRFVLVLSLPATVLLLMAPPALAETPHGALRFSKRCLMVNPNEGCAIGDVNRDGKPDIVAGTHWFAGPDFIPRPIREIGEYRNDAYHNNGDHLYDINGDGWLDVISGTWKTPELCWFENPGKVGLAKGLKWKRHLLKKSRPENEAFVLKDFDGDGVPEIYVACWINSDPQVIWKIVKGADGEPDLERIVIGPQGGHAYGFGDVDGDGREDIVTESGWYERPEKDVLSVEWKFHAETALPRASTPVIVADVDGDGRNDILYGLAHDYGVFWRKQGTPKADGTTTWEEHLIDKEWSQAHTLAWADLDGDNRPELITGKRVRAHSGKDPGAAEPAVLYYYSFDPKTNTFTRYPLGKPGEGIGTGMQIRVADLNADGRPDVVAPGKTGVWVLMNEGRE